MLKLVDQVAQLRALGRGEPLRADEVRQQSGQGAAAELFRDRSQAAADQLVAADAGAECVDGAGAVALDERLTFKAFEQLLDGGVARRRAGGVEAVGQLPDRRRAAVPQGL